jgi:hypothetical protein
MPIPYFCVKKNLSFMKKLFLLLALCQSMVYGQTPIPLNDLSAFVSKSTNWKIVSDVNVDIDKKNTVTSVPGTGVLLCEHEQGKYGLDYDLFSKLEHGDLDMEFDFMMAKGSNSGVYLQGRYEIQLNDSWGANLPKYYDCGGIYERWNDSKPDGQKGYEGYAPRFNAYKAPGLWQNMKISFQAPRFDANGKKIANAKILSIKLNNVLLHENVELSGVTRGSISQEETKSGPLRIQGDHGSVAFRNIVVSQYDKTPGKVSDLSYKVYYGSYMHDLDLSTLKIDERGKTDDLTWEVTKKQNDYVFVIKGTYTAPMAGKYTFFTQLGGNSTLKIDNKEILGNNWTLGSQQRQASIELTAGEHTFEIFNNKRDGWIKPTLGFWSEGPGFRSTAHHVVGSMIASKPSDPILVEANTNTTLRSFMDFKKSPNDKNFRIVHAISVGSPEKMHYTYDLDKGAIVQIWKGQFLDATPMWEDRGDGSSRPLGSVTLLNHDLTLTNNPNSSWPKDTVGTGYKPMGYILDENDLPTFKYKIYGSDIQDKIRIADNKMFTREISLSKSGNIVARIAEGSKIEKVGEGLYAVDGKSYFIRTSGQATIKKGTELIASPVDNKIIYSIIF